MERIALVGKPNCGKTSLFNVLTGLQQKVGNYAGVTVDRISGKIHTKSGNIELIDLPGLYSLYPAGEDEKVAADTLVNPIAPDHPDRVVMVADVTNLRQCLYLTTQILDLGYPCMLVLNMADMVDADEVKRIGNFLMGELGIDVVPVSVKTGMGIKSLRNLLEQPFRKAARTFLKVPTVSRERQPDTASLTDYHIYHLGLLKKENATAEIRAESAVRFDLVDTWGEILQERATDNSRKRSDQLDAVLLHPFGGYAIFIGILLLIFQVLFSWSGLPMDLIDIGMGKLASLVDAALPDSWWANLISEGIIPGIAGIVIFVPQIAFLFLIIGILEESGYMSRVIFLMDRMMRPLGFSGKSIIPLIGGMACAVPSIMMARNIPNSRERLITILVTPLISCSARLPVYALIIGMFIPARLIGGVFDLRALVMLLLYLSGFIMAFVIAGITNRFLPAMQESPFLVELPLYRFPSWRNLAAVVYQKSKAFVWEAGKVILVISILLWFLASFGPGDTMDQVRHTYDAQIETLSAQPDMVDSLSRQRDAAALEASYAGIAGKWMEPVIRPIGFNWKIGIALITSFAAREVFVGTLSTIYSVQSEEDDPETLSQQLRADTDPITGLPVYTLATGISILLFYAFAMQCMSTLAIVKRETRGWKWPLIMLTYMTAIAWISSWIAYQSLS